MSGRPIRLDRLQYDVCWNDLGLGEYLPPLTIPGHGGTDEERRLLRAQVYDQLIAARLATPRPVGPPSLAAVLADALTLLSNARTWLAMTWLPHAGATSAHGAVGARLGNRGVVAGLDDTHLHLWSLAGDHVIAGLLDLLPAAPPAPGRPVSVPMHSTSQAGDSIYDSHSRSRTDRHRDDRRAAGQLLTRPAIRGGLITAHARQPRRESDPVHWQDTADGRLVTYRSDRAHSTVAPGDPARLHDLLRDLLHRVAS